MRRLATEVGTRLARMLGGAGAQTLVLEEDVPDEEKVRRAELFGAEIYLRIELSSHGSASVLHYPGSSGGIKLAHEIARSWADMFSAREPLVREDAHYVVRQTSCPAVLAVLPVPTAKTDEDPAPTLVYALYLGILEDFGLKRDQLARLIVTPINRASHEGIDVVLDDFIPLRAWAGKSVVFFCEEGLHLVKAQSRDGTPALKCVDLRKGGETTVELILD